MWCTILAFGIRALTVPWGQRPHCLISPTLFAACDADRVLQVPLVVQKKALALGQRPWLDALPEMVADLAAEWSLTISPVFEDAARHPSTRRR